MKIDIQKEIRRMKMAFLDKVLGRDERQDELKKEIRSLELRKEYVFSSITHSFIIK